MTLFPEEAVKSVSAGVTRVEESVKVNVSSYVMFLRDDRSIYNQKEEERKMKERGRDETKVLEAKEEKGREKEEGRKNVEMPGAESM